MIHVSDPALLRDQLILGLLWFIDWWWVRKFFAASIERRWEDKRGPKRHV